jgi:phosphoglucomutase
MCCEMVARRGKSLGAQLQELFVKVGSFYPQRENFRLTQEVKAKFTEKLRSEPQEFFGRKVGEVVRKDGLKLVFQDGSWICYRLSGTEPVVRVYSEAANAVELARLSAAAKQWIFE